MRPQTRGGSVGIEAGEDEGALRQAGDGGHEGAGGAARAGGAGDDHRVPGWARRPGGRQAEGRGAQPALALGRPGRGDEGGDEREKAQAPLPVGGMVGGIDAREGGGVDALALHLVQELGQALGQLEGGGAGGEVGLGLGEAGHQPRQLELAAKRGHRRGERRGERVVGELGEGADARKQARRALGEDGRQGAGGAAGVEPDLDAGDRLGRLAGEPGVEAGGERPGEIDAGRQGEDAGAVARGKEAAHAISASASAMPSGRPTSTQPPACTVARSRPAARSASQTGLSEKAPSPKPSSAAGSMISAPA